MPRRRDTHAVLAVLAALLAILVSAAPAAASSASYTPASSGRGASVSVGDTAAQNNSLTITRSGSQLSIVDRGATVTAGENCSTVSEDEVRCPDAPELLVDTAGGDDAVRLSGDFSAREHVSVDLGPGDDVLDPAPGIATPLTVLAGLGNDVVDGAAGADAVDGGGGKDVVRTHGGSDTITDSDAPTGVGGRLDGGDGNDRITGGRGDDLLLGGAGNDSLRGAGGLDVYRAGDGADAVDARDTISESVDCGRGADRVRSGTAADDLSSACERVTGGFEMSARVARVSRRGIVTLRVPCRRRCRVGARITVVQQHGRANLAGTRRPSVRGRPRKVRGAVLISLELPPSALAELRARKALRVRVDVRRDRLRTAWITFLRGG